MTIIQLQYFVSAFQARKISVAAEKNFVSRPAISHAISDLEAELNVRLFVKGPTGIEPTEDAFRVYEQVLPLIQHYNTVLRDLPLSLHKPFLRIGFGPNLGSYTAIPILSRFKEENLDVEVEYREFGAWEENLLNSGQIDFAFGPLPFVMEDQLAPFEYVKIASIPFYLICGEDHPLAKKDHIKLKDIMSETLFLWKQDEETANWLSSVFEMERMIPKIGGEFLQLSTIISLVSEGLGVSFVIPDVVEKMDGVVTRKLEELDECEVYVIWRRNISLTPEKKKFINFIRNIYSHKQKL